MVVACLWSTRGRAEPSDAQPRFDIHFQATVATQAHPGFGAAYSGPHSLKTDAESATSVVMDVFTAARLWRGAELYFNPGMSGGRGLSSTLGVAAFPSGEVYRVGDPDPTIFLGRVFLRQTFGLGGGRVARESGPTQLAGDRDRDALTITIGRISTPDVLDRVVLNTDASMEDGAHLQVLDGLTLNGVLTMSDAGHTIVDFAGIRLSGGHARIHVGRVGRSRSRRLVGTRRHLPGAEGSERDGFRVGRHARPRHRDRGRTAVETGWARRRRPRARLPQHGAHGRLRFGLGDGRAARCDCHARGWPHEVGIRAQRESGVRVGTFGVRARELE